jgi:methyl-accepting chemotaxis protein
MTAAGESFDRFMEVDERIIAGYRAGTRAATADANALASGESLEWMGRIIGSIDELVALTTERSDVARAGAADAADTARTAMIVAGLICLFLAVGVAVLITRSITRPLRDTVTALRTVAAKDLTVRVPDTGRDELASMGRAVNTTLAVLREAFGSIADNSRTLAAAAQQLTATSTRIAGAADSASGQSDIVAAAAEEVSRSVQTVAAGTEEMNAAIREISDGASRVAGVAATGVDSVRAAGETNRPDRGHHRRGQRALHHDRRRGRGADRHHRRDEPQHRRGRHRLRPDRREHHRRRGRQPGDRHGLSESRQTVEQLARMSDDLRDLVGQFRV